MTNTQTDDIEKIICHCSGTSKKQILELIAQGIGDLTEISWQTGAAAGCGGCETWIMDLLAAEKTC